MFTGHWSRGRDAVRGLNIRLCTASAQSPLRSRLSLHEETTMAISMHSASVPIFVRMLGNLRHLARQGRGARDGEEVRAVGLPDGAPRARHAALHDPDPDRLRRRQVLRRPPRRHRSAEVRRQRDQLADLRQRIAKTIDYLKSVPAAQIDGSEEKDIIGAAPRRRRSR